MEELLKIILEEEFKVSVAYTIHMKYGLLKREYKTRYFKYEIWRNEDNYFLKYKGSYHILGDDLVSVLLLKMR